MAGVRHIVVGAGLATKEHAAVTVAGNLAKALGATLTVVHVDEKLAFVPGSDLALREQQADEAAVGEIVASLAAQGVRVRGLVRAGVVADGLCAVAREERAELLVVGTPAAGLFPVAVLGSVAERVVRSAPCPVVTVRKPARGSPFGLFPSSIGAETGHHGA